MNVTAETSGQSPWPAKISSAPRPFWTVMTAAPSKQPTRAHAAASTPVAFVATITRSGSPISRTACVALTRSVKSPFRPVTRSPSCSSAHACSGRRASTETSHTRAR